MDSYRWEKYANNSVFNFQRASQKWSSTRIDPYLVWAYATGFSDVDIKTKSGNRYLPIAIELTRGSRHGTVAVFAEACQSRSYISIPAIYHVDASIYRDIRYLTAVVEEKGFLRAMDGNDEVLSCIERFQLGLAIKTQIGKGIKYTPGRMYEPFHSDIMLASQKNIERRPIVGIVDDGIGFLNHQFTDANGRSRIRYFWNQNGGRTVPQTVLPASKEYEAANFGYGYQLTGSDIDTIRDSSPISNSPRYEEKIYRKLKYTSVASHVTHGTHMMDLAAGKRNEENSLDVDSVPILAVQLHNASNKSSDTSGRWLAVNMLDALRYILERAVESADTNLDVIKDWTLAMPKIFGTQGRAEVYWPVLINVSYGNVAGPHDGSSILEQAADELIQAHSKTQFPLSVYMSSGNHKQARCHACVSVLPGSAAHMHWRVYPDDRTPSFMEIWLPQMNGVTYDEECIEVGLCAPGQEISEVETFIVGECWSLLSDDGNVECVVVGLAENQNAAGSRGMFLCALGSTYKSSHDNRAKAGLWTVVVKNKGTKVHEINSWIERDESTINAQFSGRQSHFEDASHSRYDSWGYPYLNDIERNGIVRVEGTINGIGTGEHTYVVGAKKVSDDESTHYSGIGTVSDQSLESREFQLRKTVLYSAVDDSAVIGGAIATGTLSGSKVSLGGTSAASALVVREVLEGYLMLDKKDKNINRSLENQSANSSVPRLTKERKRRGMAKLHS